MDRKLQQLENCKQLQNLYECKKYKITHESIFKLLTYAIMKYTNWLGCFTCQCENMIVQIPLILYE